MRLICGAILLLVCSSAFSFETSAFNLVTPTELDAHDIAFSISHRFYGPVTEKPFDTMFGLDAGANVGLDLRWQFLPRAELGIARIRRGSEWRLGGSYKVRHEEFPVQGQIDLAWFSYKDPSQQDETRHNVQYLVSLRNDPLFGRASFVADVGYDGYLKRLITGCGVIAQVTEAIAVVGEWQPVTDRNSADDRTAAHLGSYDAWAAGVKLDTYAHHFKLMLGNSPEIGVRRASCGTDNPRPMLGFAIERRFDR
jgi:hypothetical protein